MKTNRIIRYISVLSIVFILVSFIALAVENNSLTITGNSEKSVSDCVISNKITPIDIVNNEEVFSCESRSVLATNRTFFRAERIVRIFYILCLGVLFLAASVHGLFKELLIATIGRNKPIIQYIHNLDGHKE